MILTVCANPCIDKTITINGIVMGQYNKIIDSMINPSGKGINVGVTLTRLGGQAFCTGFNYESNGSILTQWLDKEKTPCEFVYSPGEIRTNIKVIDIESGVMTEFNESGRFASEEKKQELEMLWSVGRLNVIWPYFQAVCLRAANIPITPSSWINAPALNACWTQAALRLRPAWNYSRTWSSPTATSYPSMPKRSFQRPASICRLLWN